MDSRNCKLNKKAFLITAIIAVLLFSVAAALTLTKKNTSAHAAREGEDCAVLMYQAHSGSYTVTGIDTANDYNRKNALNLKIVIPAEHANAPVTAIADRALSAFANARFQFASLDLSGAANLKTIGKQAFASNEKLTSLDLSGAVNLETIDDQAFYNCAYLSGPLTIPANVKKIGVNAFFGCDYLNALVLNPGLTDIGRSAFFDCEGFTGSLTIPGSVTNVGESAFYDCSSLETVYLPSGAAYGATVFNGVDCPIVAPGKEQYEAYIAEGHELAQYKKRLTYETDVTFDAGLGTLSGEAGRTVVQKKLCAYALNYEKNEDTGVWAQNSGYVLPAATRDLHSHEGYADGRRGVQVTPETPVTDAATYTAIWKEITSAILTYRKEGDAYVVTGIDEGDPYHYNQTNKDNLRIAIPATYGGAPVTAIADQAFQASSNPDFTFAALDLSGASNLKTIGASAFSGCKHFTGTLTIPNKVTSIGVMAFYGGEGFGGTLAIPASVTVIGDDAFNGFSGFNALDLSGASNLKTIGASAFDGCKGFRETLSIPTGTEDVGDNAFRFCTGFSVLDMSRADNLKTIGARAFAGCTGFGGTLLIPESVTSIGEASFSGCAAFSALDLSGAAKLQSISARTFYNCTGFGETLTIPDSVTKIGDEAFDGCAGFGGKLTIPENVTLIGLRAFFECSGFSALELSGAVRLQNISAQAFYDCAGLKSTLTIPDSVTGIGDKAFYGCSGFSGTLTIPSGVTGIGVAVFSGCSGFSALDLSGATKLKTVSENMFNGCKGFGGTLMIPAGVTSIGERAFFECSGFSVLDLSGAVNLDTIGVQAFYGCKGFGGTLSIPESVTDIGEMAFYSCKGFGGKLTIPGSVIGIGDNAFYGCTGFNGALVLSPGLVDIGNSAFNGCSGFTGSMTIPESVKNVGNYAFLGCSGLGTVYLPSSENVVYQYSVFDGIVCPIVAPDKDKYKTYIATGNSLAGYKKLLTYETDVTFAADGGTISAGGGSSVTQTKLFGYALSYEKSADKVWKQNAGYVLPAAEKSTWNFGGYTDSVNAPVTIDTPVTDAAIYTARWWRLTAPDITDASDNYSGVYDGDAHSISVTASHVEADVTLSYKWYKKGSDEVLSEEPTLSLRNVSDSGTYYCVVTASYGDQTLDANGEEITVQIDKADYDMNGVTFADGTVVYDGSAHSLTVVGTLPTGFDGIQVTVTYTGGDVTDVSDGTVTATFATTSGNYNVPPARTAELKITKKTVTVTAESKTTLQGEDLAVLTYTASGLLGGDTLSGGLTSSADKDAAGTYPIILGTLVCGKNYEIAFVGANYYVNHAALETPEPDPADPDDTDKISGKIEKSDGFHTGTTLEIKVTPAEEAQNTLLLPRGKKFLQSYDARLYTDGVETALTGNATLKIARPESLPESGSYIVLIVENGVAVQKTATLEGGWLVFETSELGNFAIIVDQETNMLWLIILVIAVAAIGLAVVGVAVLRKSHGKHQNG